MRKPAVVGIVFASLFLFAVGVSAETKILAEVDKSSLNTDETLTYKLIITSSEKKLPAPKLPGFEGFNVISQAQSSTLSFLKSNIKTILVYSFILAPTDTGKLTIEPASIKIEGKTYSADTLEIEVRQGKTEPKPKQKPPLPKRTQPEPEQPQITL